jgi:hypothetical protein
MTSLPSNFPRRVRIHGGGFDASARAMHREAAFENVSNATIERKTMSTKTTFKRLALVALGIGMVSAVPSNAASTFADVTVYSAGTQIVGGQATITLAVDTITTNVAVTGVGSLVSATQLSGSAAVGTITNGSFTVTSTGTGSDTIVLTSSVVGTQTITATPVNQGNGAPGTAVTKTITWIAGATNASVNHSTAFINTVVGSESVADATSITNSATLASAGFARIDVRQYASTDSSIPTAVASTQAVTVSIAGAGSVSTTASSGATGPSVTIAAATVALATFYVYPNGVGGTGTITISVGGVTVATKTVTLAGSLASYKLTPTNTVTAISGLADVVTVGPLDSNGNAATLGTYYVTSSDALVATVPSAGQTGTTFSVTGVAVGTATITVANAATAPTITKTYTVTVGKATAKTVTITTDKTSYAAGEKITLTVTAVGSDGTAVGDKALFLAFSSTGLTSNVALQGFPTSTGSGVALVGGVAKFTIYAPLSDGTVTIQGTEGTGIDHVIADSTTAAVLSASFDVSNPGSAAAVDAANAATDAANYAADAADAATTAAQEATAAAQAAQDSADAATAAVVALGLRVNVLMASVRAQLTSLSNLLVRIIKKTHA